MKKKEYQVSINARADRLYFDTLPRSKKEAQMLAGLQVEPVIIDEYDNEAEELTGVYWKVTKRGITKEMFDAYETVRVSGKTNMYDSTAVIELALMMSDVLISRDEVREIIGHYDELCERYL